MKSNATFTPGDLIVLHGEVGATIYLVTALVGKFGLEILDSTCSRSTSQIIDRSIARKPTEAQLNA